MYPEDAVNAKLQAEKAYYGEKASPPSDPYPQDVCQKASTPSRLGDYSLRDAAAKLAHHHHEEASKAQSAALFFSQNPAFEDFIRLIRQGAIQF